MIEKYRLVIEYLKSLGAIVTESSGKAAVQLTEQLDRKFMNRPFYWHYRDALHQPGDPLHIIITDSTGAEMHKDVIQIYPDHPIFQSIFHSAQIENRFYTAYENTEALRELFPWMTIDLTAEAVPPGSASIRFNGRMSLMTGRMVMSNLNTLEDILTADRPNGSILRPHKIPYETSLNRLNHQLEKYIEDQFNLKTKKVEPAAYIHTYHISAGLVYLQSP
ncbi:YqhG family protein [Jeotgalibacillus malaysiensis]|uniref:YqhG family protein n=1 Tax=Jeotgalibacillus malaysiensis TaxID=1508404 RepID=UPI003850F661